MMTNNTLHDKVIVEAPTVQCPVSCRDQPQQFVQSDAIAKTAQLATFQYPELLFMAAAETIDIINDKPIITRE